MSTRCRIGYYDMLSDQVRSVYCHHDGYPEYVGFILSEFYQDPYKVQDLIKLGAISTLGQNLDLRGDENKNGTLDYHRWRGEPIMTSVDFGISNYEANVFENYEEYAYLFIAGVWFISEDGGSWKLLEHFV